jgi:alkylation response protein AidB-like acyl-CoA dehydrogenase
MSTSTKQAIALAKDLAQQLKSRAFEADKKGELPREDVQALKKSGYLRLCIPKAYGGYGVTLEDCVAAQLELSQGSGSTALVAVMTLNIMAHATETQPWSSEIYQHFCQEVVNGALINAVASEPRLGSPSRGGLPDTYAVLQNDTLIINGHKTWVTGGEHLDHLLVRLRLNDEAVIIWIPASTPGLHWEKTWGHGLSLRGSDSHDLHFENVVVPARCLIESGPGTPNVCFPLLVAATYLGIAIAARDDAIHYALERVPTALGKPIATLPSIQRQIGEIDIELQAAQALLGQTASAWKVKPKQRQSFLAKAAAAKYVAIETALSVTDKAMRVVGAAGLESGLALERYFRDVRAGLMHPPSGDAALELVGKQVLNIK